MIATKGTYKLLSLEPYLHLFPRARVVDLTAKKGADVSDTVAFIPGVIWKTRWQVRRFVEAELASLPTKEALMKLWFWVKCHIPYGPDKRGKEQVKTARRTVYDATQGKGSDCDDMTTFISSCASWLGGIKSIIHTIAKYGGLNWQHIYPTVILDSGERIIMDCVTDAWNYEKKPTQRQEHIMDLELLDGIDDYDELGKFSIKNLVSNVTNAVKTEVKTAGQAISTAAQKTGNAISTAVQKTGEAIKENAGDVLHAINKVNPATVLLRTGVLAAMKLNMMNVAGRLRWAYLPDADVAKSGIDKSGHDKLKKIMSKLEEIFHGAGGEPENLKKEVLEGKGNKDHAVAGLGALSIYAPLSEVLEPETFASEFDQVEGLGELGEVVTATSLAAATGAIATIAGLLKQIGNLFPKGSAGAKDFDAGDTETPDASEPSTASLITNITSAVNTIKQAAPIVSNVVNTVKQVAPVVNTVKNLTSLVKKPDPVTPLPFSATQDSYEASQTKQATTTAAKPKPLSISAIKLLKTSVPVTKAATVNPSFSAQVTPEQTTDPQFVQPTVVPPQNYVSMPPGGTTTDPNAEKKDEKKGDVKERPKWLVPTIIGGTLILGGIVFAMYRAGQKRKLALAMMSKKNTPVNGTEDEVGYVLVEETVTEPKATKPQAKAQKPEPLEGFVLVDEEKQMPAPKAEPKKEDYVLVEETKPKEELEEQLTAVPLM